MSDGPNWSALVEQGRAKALGVSWSDEELRAIHELKIPVDYVRGGCVSTEQYQSVIAEVNEEVKSGKKKPVRYMSKGELLKEAQELHLSVSDVTTRAELILLIEKELSKSKLEVTLPDDDAVIQESVTS